MGRRIFVLTIVGALVAFALVAASPAPALTKPTTIALRAVATAPPLVTPDADGNGVAGPGDTTLLSLQLLNSKKQFGKAAGAQVGQGAVIQWAFAPGGLGVGLAAFQLPQGVIMSSGYASFTRTFTVAVIGGTGQYANVTGTVSGVPVSQTEFRTVINLRPASS